METEELIKTILVVVVLAILIGGIIFLLKEKGGSLLDSLRTVMRFGR